MNKIASDHLAREAVVYIRQSTPDQLRHNHESRRRQYGLADRARGLGWDEPVVIDEDLGRSGGGTSRPGFDRLLVAICEGRVGIVLSLEASRLARNGRDWHTLLEFCALVGCLLGDEDGLYDPRHGHGIVIRPVAHQGQRVDPRALLVARVERCRQWPLQRFAVTHKPFADALAVAAQDVALPVAALLFQVAIEEVPARERAIVKSW